MRTLRSHALASNADRLPAQSAYLRNMRSMRPLATAAEDGAVNPPALRSCVGLEEALTQHQSRVGGAAMASSGSAPRSGGL
jgi:hypothetical protein